MSEHNHAWQFVTDRQEHVCLTCGEVRDWATGLRQERPQRALPTPRIATPEEAQAWIDGDPGPGWTARHFARAVTTEPDRTRAAVVKALRNMGGLFAASGPYPQGFAEAAYCNERADEIENGADW